MNSSREKELESKLKIISEFLKSEEEKIHLIIGSDESSLYSFLGFCLSRVTETKGHLVFRYEIWEREHSRHFLFRWLYETVFGQAFVGFGQWLDIINRNPQLLNQLRLLIKQDNRPLEIRFLEALQFISRILDTSERIIIAIVPRTGMDDIVLVDFFKAILRVIPRCAKMLIFQDQQDVLARQSDFSPSNRIILPAFNVEELAKIKERYRHFFRSDSIKGRLIRALAYLVHPVDLDLIAQLTGETKDRLAEDLASSDLKGLLDQLPESRFRLAYPRMFFSISNDSFDFGSIDKQALEYFETRLSDETNLYSNALYHSLGLFRINDPEYNASHVLAAYQTKLNLGGGDICEQELNRVLSLVGDEHDQLRIRLLLTLADICESRSRYLEAMKALDPAIEMLKNSENITDLQHALKLKGKAALSMREMDTAKTALEESLNLAREMGRVDLSADTLSQLAHVYFSSNQHLKAEKLYRESLDSYRNISKAHHTKGRRGEASQWANLGHTAYAKGQFDKAQEFHRRALEIYESLTDRKAAADQWGYLGHVLFALKNHEQAVEAYERAAELEEEIGEPNKAAQRFAGAGYVLYAQRKAEAATRFFQKALNKYRELGHAEGEASQLSNLGLVKGDQGESEGAMDFFDQAARIYHELGDEINEAIQVTRMGHVRRTQKRYDEAVKNYEDALNRFQKLKYPMGEGDTELDLGRLYSEKKEWEKALGCYHRAMNVFKTMGRLDKESLCFELTGSAQQGLGKADSAMNSYRKAIEFYKKSGDSLGVANVASQMGMLQYEQKNYGEAVRLYREALDIFRKKEDVEGEANLLISLGTLFYQTQELNKAREEFEKALSVLRKMNHSLGIASVLKNLSYVYEKKGQYKNAYTVLREARQIYDQLNMPQEVEVINNRIKSL